MVRGGWIELRREVDGPACLSAGGQRDHAEILLLLVILLLFWPCF